MNKRIHKRTFLLAIALLLLVGLPCVLCFVWVRKEQRQYALDRQLITALRQGDFNSALHLVEVGADPNTPALPPPALTWRELLRQLLNRSKSALNSPTAFMLVCGDSPGNDDNDVSIPKSLLHDPQLTLVAQSMLVRGAHVNAIDKYGTTALMNASVFGLTDRMVLLMEHGAVIDLQDPTGQTALFYAMWGNETEAVKILLKYHANPNAKNNAGKTALYAAQNQAWFDAKPEVIRLLKQAGARE